MAVLAPIERRKIVEEFSDIGMARPARPLHDRDRVLVHRLGLAIATDFAMELRKIVQGAGKITAVRL